jgi:hypothetical protein
MPSELGMTDAQRILNMARDDMLCQAAEMARAMTAAASRISDAADSGSDTAYESAIREFSRIHGKAEGVTMALETLDRAVRIHEASS